MKILLFIIIALSVSSCALPSSGRGSLEGRVFYERTGDPLSGASVVYGDSAVFTDESGNYIYEDLPEGLQGMAFVKEGYHTQVMQVNILSNKVAQCDVSLRLVTTGWAVGMIDSGYGVILHTSDGGQNWLRQGSPAMIPEAKLNSVCAIDSSNCWVVGDRESFKDNFVILKTADGGNTWSNQGASLRNYPTCSLKSIIAKDKNSAWCIAADTSYIFSTSNGGKNWTLCDNSEDAAYYTAITTPDGINIWCCGADKSGMPIVNYSADGGESWKVSRINTGGASYNVTDIYALNENELYVTGDNGMGVFYSSDKGATWKRLPNAGNGENLNSIFVFDSNNIWLAADNGKLYYSNDGFNTTVAQHIETSEGENVTKINMMGDGVFGGGIITSPSGESSKLIYTIDGGSLWSYGSIPYDFAFFDLDFIGGNN